MKQKSLWDNKFYYSILKDTRNETRNIRDKSLFESE